MAGVPSPSQGGKGFRIAKSTITEGSFAKKSSQHQENYLWTGAAITNLEKGPVPSPRTEPQDTYVSYVEFQRGNIKSTKVTKRTWLMNTLALLRKVDPHIQILPYDSSSKINSISYPVHIPQTNDQLAMYFPRMYLQSGHMTAKCKIQSSLPINQIKWKIMPQLEAYNYYIQPTQLKALRTGKAGWFLGAHPDLTYRVDFVATLKPIVYQHFGKDLEFQIIPEIEKITVGNKTIKQRVLVVRCDLQEVENFRAFFSEIFSQGSKIDLSYLTRYTFITAHPVGSCTKMHLQAILKNQQEFHKNVHYYIMYGIDNLNMQFPVLPNEDIQQLFSDAPSPQSVPTNEKPSSQHQESPLSQDSVTRSESGSIPVESVEVEHPTMMEVEENSGNREPVPPNLSDASNIKDPVPKSQALSLRYLMYLSVASTGTSLFHAVYPSSESGKIYCLCTQENREEALRLLHHLEDTSANYFQEEHLRQIFVGHKNQAPYVKDYPKVSGHYKDYAADLVNLVAGDNPQGDNFSPDIVSPPVTPALQTYDKSYAQSLSHHNPPTAKRHRGGSNIPTPSPVSHSRLPTGMEDNIAINERLNATVTETIARMKNLEKSTQSQGQHLESVHTTLESHGSDIALMGKAIDSNSKSITRLLEAHSLQQQTITKIDNKQSSMQQDMSEVLQFTRNFTKQFADTPDGMRGNQS